MVITTVRGAGATDFPMAMFDVQTDYPGSNCTVVPVPALEDNYMYLIICNVTKEAAVVDPVKPKPIFAEAERRGVTIK